MRHSLLASTFLLSCALFLQDDAAAAGSDPVDEDLYTSAIRLVRDRYLFPETVTAEALLEGSVVQLTDEIEWLMAEIEGNQVQLRHGDDPAFASIDVGGLDDLPRAMVDLENAVREAGFNLDEDLKLGVSVLKGATERLDRHSVILAGRRLERFEERISGKLTGIGMRYGPEDGEFLVRYVFPGGPADIGGLQADDALLRIDRISTTGMTTDDVKDRIRGEVGTTVLLQVRRGERILDLGLERAEVSIPNLEQEILPSGVGYLSIAHFSEQTVENLRRALAELAAQGALERGLVLDLRGNTGGSMIQAARSADQFLTDGRLVRTVGRDGAPVSNLIRQMDADDEGTEPPVPLVVLADGNTASGSEILAGDLMLLDRAILVGSRTYGKGTVQKIYNLRPDVRLKLTVAEYLLVDDISVAANLGLEPDVPTGEVVFDLNGVRYYNEGARDQGVLFVRERPGWRGDEEDTRRDDPEVALAERIVLRSRGPRRGDVLAAARVVVEEAALEEDSNLLETYLAGGIDWSPAPSEGPEPLVEVRLEPDGPPHAGESVVLRVRVDNRGDEPLHRVRVHLWSQNKAWSRVSLPVGLVPAGGSAEGRRTVKLSASEPSRVDDVSIEVFSDRRPSTTPTHTQLKVRGRTRPDVSVSGKLLPHSPAIEADGRRSWRAELTLQNHGKEDLHGVRVRFDFPEEDGVELVDHEGMLPHLAAGEQLRLDLCLLTSPEFPGQELDLDLRIDAEHWGRLARWSFPLPLDGAVVRHQAPTVRIDAPATARADQPTRIEVQARDDVWVDHAVVYANGKKHRWTPGGERRLATSFDFEPATGSNRVVVTVEDDQGHRTRATAYVLGLVPDEPAVAEESEEAAETP